MLRFLKASNVDRLYKYGKETQCGQKLASKVRLVGLDKDTLHWMHRKS